MLEDVVSPVSGSAWRKPAAIALMIQALSFLILLIGVKLALRFTDFHLVPLLLACVQGVIAAVISKFCRLALWWLVIQFIFPTAILLAIALHLPPSLFLGAFIFTMLLYWGTFRTQVPYFPSGQEVWHEVAMLMPARPANVVDIGSGLGGLLLSLAKSRQDCQLLGVELAPLPWLLSYVRAKLSGSKVEFTLLDYEKLNLADFDVVFAYLAPPAMSPLWAKAVNEMKPGSLLLSYEFMIHDKAPDFQKMIKSRQVMLYGWRF